MKTQSGAAVFYFILRAIETSTTETHLDNCAKLVNLIGRKYGFADHLAAELLIKKCAIVAEPYPVYE